MRAKHCTQVPHCCYIESRVRAIQRRKIIIVETITTAERLLNLIELTENHLSSGEGLLERSEPLGS